MKKQTSIFALILALFIIIFFAGCTSPRKVKSGEFVSVESAPLLVEKTLTDTEAEQTEKAHLCGAKTKKGKACTRRVKTTKYCWQHQDQEEKENKEKTKKQ